MNTYIVAATGGLDVPSFNCYQSLTAALALFDFATDTSLNYPGDRVDLLSYDGIITRTIDFKQYEDTPSDS